jgi:hypothetical protein
MLDSNILDVGNCNKQGAAGKDPSLPMSSMVPRASSGDWDLRKIQATLPSM